MPLHPSGRQSRIFLSYRREDTSGFAPAVQTLLGARLGKESVVRDVDVSGKLRRGPYREYLAKQLRPHDVVVALIGSGWSTATDDNGRRIDDPEDFNRQELELALERDIAVIPVLVEDAPMPTAAELPSTLARLADTPALRLSSRRFLADVDELVNVIERVQRNGLEQAREEIRDRARHDVLDDDLVSTARQRAEGGELEAARQTAVRIDDRERREETLSAIAEQRERHESDAREGPQSLAELVQSAGLRYTQVDETLAMPYRSWRADELSVTARMLRGEQDLAFFAVDLPNSPKLGREAAFRNLLQVSFTADYVKAMTTTDGTLRLAVELRPPALTASVVRGVVDGLALLADVKSGDLRDSGWEERLEQLGSAQARQIDIDVAEARRTIPDMLAAAGLEANELGRDVFATKLRFRDTDEHYPVAVKAQKSSISFVGFTPLTPKGDKASFLHNLLELNRVASVAKIGLDQDHDVALLYDVPRLYPHLIEDVEQQFGLLLLGLLGLETAA
jgi:hypothetical protein